MIERRSVLLAILLMTMTASSFQIFALAVLAVDIIDDLEISRTALGLLGSLNTLVGALTAPAMGRFTDRIGSRQSVIVVLMISGLGMAAMALSTNWMLLAGAAIVAGIPQGWGNPATNALIAERVQAGAQGTVTGIKQSGVQLGIFLSGLTVPGLAILLGWRGAMWGFAAIFFLSALLVIRFLPRIESEPEFVSASPDQGAASAEDGPPFQPQNSTTRLDPQPTDDAVPSFIWLLALYALFFGTAGGAIGRFFPLWANEEVGLSTVTAGLIVAVSGLLGIGARIMAGRLAENRIEPQRLLSMLAMLGAVYCVVLLLTPTLGSWVLWPSAALNAVGIGAWNAVAMLAVIMAVPRRAAGKASGIVMLGFLGGLSIGSPIAGWVVDQWGTYQPVWIGAAALSVLSAVVVRPRNKAKTSALS